MALPAGRYVSRVRCIAVSAILASGIARAETTGRTLDSGYLFSQADVVCKIKLTGLKQTGTGGLGEGQFEASCHLLSNIKGEPADDFKFGIMERFPGMKSVDEGKVYLVYLKGKDSLEFMEAAPAEEAPAELTFGKDPIERMLAELIATSKDKDPTARQEAIGQIGKLRDPRGGKTLKPLQNDPDEAIARGAVMALYRLGIAPDVKKVMALFNPEVMDTWYQESGKEQLDDAGQPKWHRENGVVFYERGLPDFDYATYVREGIKHDWVRKDYNTLYTFFGVPWKVQRRACVPELVKLLGDADVNVRGFAVLCLNHTVNDKDEPQVEAFKKAEASYIAQWKTWWKDSGEAYMAKEPDKAQ